MPNKSQSQVQFFLMLQTLLDVIPITAALSFPQQNLLRYSANFTARWRSL